MARYLAVIKNNKWFGTYLLSDVYEETLPAEILAQVGGDSFIIHRSDQYVDEDGTLFDMPSPYPSWIWSEEDRNWQAPVVRPDDTYEWNEEIVNWEPPTE